jgi:hypothetical protein
VEALWSEGELTALIQSSHYSYNDNIILNQTIRCTSSFEKADSNSPTSVNFYFWTKILHTVFPLIEAPAPLLEDLDFFRGFEK